MILQDTELLKLGKTLLTPFDPKLVNPASIDIRIGNSIMLEYSMNNTVFVQKDKPYLFQKDLRRHNQDDPFFLPPGAFCLAETFERITIPNGYAMELKLKSSRAREGYNHALAFWFDPGWDGKGTLEITNQLQHHSLPLYPGLKIGQIIIHQLYGLSEKPYQGNYQGSQEVRPSVHI